GGQADADGVRAEVGGGAACGQGAVGRRAAGGGRVPPRRRPPRPLGAAAAETSPETGDAPDAAASRRQAAAEPPEILWEIRRGYPRSIVTRLMLVPFVSATSTVTATWTSLCPIRVRRKGLSSSVGGTARFRRKCGFRGRGPWRVGRPSWRTSTATAVMT